ncbi:hypothetical protein DYBT9275_06112 [Dyadobacter sp. CECT 9275]|uniref:Uncharacterized protein n=1 Tax=Dyadobacter helix TaxID=2822344 RepID=A0A916NEU3_9BACT|nr:hypothetical protein DYBT9275_06112 [Dyadobacter sp. CECT 9275]
MLLILLYNAALTAASIRVDSPNDSGTHFLTDPLSKSQKNVNRYEKDHIKFIYIGQCLAFFCL